MNWQTVKKIDSNNENVYKYVFEKEDAVAESVLYKYPDFQTRTVICCSTQSGCPVGCRFCGAGDSFVRSLSAEEIISQPVHLLKETGVDANSMGRLQIMFMSMGEPMLNWKRLSPALSKLYHLYPKAALLISTSAPDVDYFDMTFLSTKIPTIGLQFSIHESTDEARDKLIPFKKKLNLQQIAIVGKLWAKATGRRPFFNYCVHDKNNTDLDVSRLCSLFSPEIWESTISVICERNEHMAAANERQRSLAANFMDKMIGVGYSTRMFDPAGQDDIGGGCGQLWFVQEWMRNHPNEARESIGRSLPVLHTPV